MEHYGLTIVGHKTAQPTPEEIVSAVSDVMRKKIAESNDELLKTATGFKVKLTSKNAILEGEL